MDDSARVAQAIEIADDLMRAAAATITSGERRRQDRLGRLVADPGGRDLVQRLTDEVLRIDRPGTAARRFAALAGRGVPSSLGRGDRLLMAAGARLARLAPGLVMPLVRRRIVAETSGLVIPADDESLTRHIGRRTKAGVQLNLNLLGEAILSDDEAEQRIARVIAALRRPDVDYISVKISAICALLDVYAFEHSVERIKAALRRVYDAAQETSPSAFVNLDMEEYGDLELTVESFVGVLDEPEYRQLPAGIVLQAYLPDSHDVMERIGAWAAQRVAGGGAPIKVRVVKGANLAMEQVDAEQHGWAQAPYSTKVDTDASYKRLLDSCLRPEWSGAVRLGVASHNLFDLAWALTLRKELPESRRSDVDIEMLEGMVPAQARAVQQRTGSMLLYCPIVGDDEFEASLAYLARRFDENTAPENFLRAMFAMQAGSAEFATEADRFRSAVTARHTVTTERLRRPLDSAATDGGTFVNQPDTDFTDAGRRADVAAAIAKHAVNGCPDGSYPLTSEVAAIDAIVARAAAALPAWSARPTAERAALLRAVATHMDDERWDTLAQMSAEAAKTIREGDPEVSEAVDFARYYAGVEIPAGVAPFGVVVVASPWNFPYAIPAGGVLAALMAGNTVILKPPPETRQTAWLLANQCWRAGVPGDVLQYVACPDDDVGRRLITHDDVATVVLTGSYATAQLFLGWKPSLRLLAETSGKNAIVVTEAADIDAAIRDVVRSAFGHAGQKCSAASLLILTAPVHDDGEFLPRLAAAVRSIRVGAADDPATMMAPLIAPPSGPLLRALTQLDPGERWLVEPRERPGSRLGDRGDVEVTSRSWTPGVRLGVAEGSWFHQTECFGPVLGVLRADDLAHAVRLQNATPFGLTGGVQSLDDDEVAYWLVHVAVGNAYVNRHITGAIVQRQPFGGWKRSSMGGAPKAGGPHYVHAMIRPAAGPIDVAAATESFRLAWDQHFAAGLDSTGLRSESNVLRHVPVDGVVVRVGSDTPSGAADAALVAARQCGVTTVVSDAGPEPEELLAARLATLGVTRLRALTAVGDELAATCHRLDIAVDRSPVSADGLLELPHWLREQAISRTMHRYGSVRPVAHH